MLAHDNSSTGGPGATQNLASGAPDAAAQPATPAAQRQGTEGKLTMGTDADPRATQAQFIDSLVGFTRQHKASHWSGTFGEFL